MSGFEIVGLTCTLKDTIDLTSNIISIIKSFMMYEEDCGNISSSLQMLGVTLQRYLDDLNHLAASPEGSHDDTLAQLLRDQESSLSILQHQLGKKISIIRSSTGGVASRSAWAIWRKRDLVRLENDLEKWVRRFHLFLASISATRGRFQVSQSSPEAHGKDHYRRMLSLFGEFEQTDSTRLPDPVEYLPNEVEVLEEEFEIGLATVRGDQLYIVEFVHYDVNEREETVKELVQQVISTAKGLCQADAIQTRILRCGAYFVDSARRRIGLLFNIPPGHSIPKGQTGARQFTLHNTWISKPPTHSLDQRFQMAKDISTGLLYVHSVGWVFKGLCPMSVILLNEDNLSETAQRKYGRLPRAFMIGVQRSRKNLGYSSLRSNQDWQLNIYRHPSRQDSEANARFSMSFDVYSLGVILLELGLWGLPHFRRFVSIPSEFRKVDEFESRLDIKLKVLISGSTPENRALGRGIHSSMGRKYRDVVEYCLDTGSSDPRSGIELVTHVWNVLDTAASSL